VTAEFAACSARSGCVSNLTVQISLSKVLILGQFPEIKYGHIFPNSSLPTGYDQLLTSFDANELGNKTV
jgi:hypothetical protein